MVAQFRCVDAAVIRVAAFGAELDLPPWPDLTGDTPEHVREWRSWLVRVWQQDALVEAIEVASPVLALRVENVCGGQVQQPLLAELRRNRTTSATQLTRILDTWDLRPLTGGRNNDVYSWTGPNGRSASRSTRSTSGGVPSASGSL